MEGKQSPSPNAQSPDNPASDASTLRDPDLATSNPNGSGEAVGGEKLKISDPRRADHLDAHKWKKGQSGNPAGRPKGTVNLTSRLKAQLLTELGNSPDDGIRADLIIHALIDEAKNGNMQAINCILDRLEGKVTDKVEMSGSSVIFNVIEAKRPE
jgi:hypothetical protein